MMTMVNNGCHDISILIVMMIVVKDLLFPLDKAMLIFEIICGAVFTTTIIAITITISLRIISPFIIYPIHHHHHHRKQHHDDIVST